MTYDINFYITLNLDHQMTKIKTADDTIFKTQEIGIINFNIFVENDYTQIVLSNVYYIPKLHANLILLKIFE